MIQRFLQPFQNMGPGFSLPQFVLRSAPHDVDTMLDKRSYQLDEREDFWLTVNDREVDDTERRLHWRELVKVIQNNQALLASFQLNDNTHPMAVAFIPNIADAFQTFIVHKLGYFFYETRFVDLVWNLGDNNNVA